MPVPRYYEMYKPILFALKDGKLHSLKELKTAVKNYFNLTNEEIAELLPSKQQTYFENRVGWAKTFLKKAGLIDSPSRAVFVLTQDGKNTVAKNPDVIDDKYLLQYDRFKPFYYSLSSNKKQQSSVNNSVKEIDKTPEDIMNEAYSEIHKRLSSELMEEILKLSPIAFERFVLDLMYKMGYGAFEGSSKTTSKTGDNGIDGIIMEDKLGFNLIYMQAKKYAKTPVGRPDIQAFFGAIAGKGGKGLFVTTSKFTSEAIDFANQQHIILIDGQKLIDYMIEYNFGVSTKAVYELKSIDTDLFDEYDYE